MNGFIHYWILGLFALAALGSPASGQDLTDVDEIVNRANLAAYYAGDDGSARVRMTITDAQGRSRTRDFAIIRRDVEDGGDQDYAVLFSRPADLRNTVFLVKKHVGSDDDRWLIIETRPGSKPFYSLAGALLPTLEDGPGEGGEEGVALGVDLAAAVFFESCSDDVALVGQ